MERFIKENNSYASNWIEFEIEIFSQSILIGNAYTVTPEYKLEKTSNWGFTHCGCVISISVEKKGKI